MAISASEHVRLNCLSCGVAFEAEVWSLVDAGERPDLAQALEDGALNEAACPRCGTANQPQIALLYHDPQRRRVYFAVPSGVEEHRWREQAQTLLYMLVERLPEEAQLPYLGDVQVDQEIAGVRRAVLRRKRARSSGQPSFGKPIPLPGASEPVAEPARPVDPPPRASTSTLMDAIEQFMSAETVAEMRDLVQRHPQLVSDEADALLQQLAETAYNEGDRDMSSALHSARTALADLRSGREVRAVAAPAPADDMPDAVAPPSDIAPRLPEAAYQALLQTASADALLEAVRLHPVLLESWADDDLMAREEAALDEGNERLATLIGERHDALTELRFSMVDAEPLEHAVQALLAARGEDALERTLTEYPALLTEDAQHALAEHAAAARTRGDERRAATIEERRTMLRAVRAGLTSEPNESARSR